MTVFITVKARNLIKWIPAVSFTVFLTFVAVSAETLLGDESKKLRVIEMYEEYKKSFPEVSDLSPQQVLKIMKRIDVVFVDVREPEEQEISMIPGAVPHKKFLENPDIYEESLIIAYCTISYRSGKFVDRLRKRGIHLINLQGGLLAWLHAGGPVHRDAAVPGTAE